MLYIDHRCNTMTLFGSATKLQFSGWGKATCPN